MNFLLNHTKLTGRMLGKDWFVLQFTFILVVDHFNCSFNAYQKKA